VEAKFIANRSLAVAVSALVAALVTGDANRIVAPLPETLLLKFATMPQASVQVPGGSVNNSEKSEV
jgi:hypothetical protein